MGVKPEAKSRWRTVAFAAAAILGIGVALFDVLQVTRPEWADSSAAARVGDAFIPMRRYRDLLSDLAQDRREPLSAADKRFALQRLIDEELLVQRARELGLESSVATLRKGMASAVIARIVAESGADIPGEPALRELYDSDRAFFTQPPQYALRWYRLHGLSSDDDALAQQIRLQLVGGDVPQGGEVAGANVEYATELPGDPLPVSSLQTYLGPSLADAATGLSIGEFSQPYFTNGVWHVLYLAEQLPANAQSFEELKPVLIAEYEKRAADEALRDYLRWLARRTDIEINPHVD